jgi:hypothetical protein
LETAEEAREAAATAVEGELEENDYEITWYPSEGPPTFEPEEETYEEPVTEEEEGDEGDAAGDAGGETEFCAAFEQKDECNNE